MSIIKFLTSLVEKITGRKCCRCRHNCGGRCAHPSDSMFMRCWHSMTRPGYEPRPVRLGKVVVKECDGDGITFTTDPGVLTPQEKHELEKIVSSLKEAEKTARDGGLLGDDKTESGLVED